MRNRHEKGTRICERKYRQILRLFSADIPSLTVAGLTSMNYRTIHRLCR